jgi:predicted ATPase
VITSIEAKGYRSLRYVSQDLDRFHVMVGPNASGKTTFFDVIRFLGDLSSGGLEFALSERSELLSDLVWRHEGDRFELAVEMDISEEHLAQLPRRDFSRCRYEVAIGIDPATSENGILAERVLLLPAKTTQPQAVLFPEAPEPRSSIMTATPARGIKTIINKNPGGSDNFHDETRKGWDHSFKLGPRKSALANLPEDESKFPVSTSLKNLLTEGIQTLVFNSLLMRRPSPPGQHRGFRTDGSNLPWVIEDLKLRSPARFDDWLAHLRQSLADLKDIRTVERPEDRHRYLVVCYQEGLEVPSWLVSDGTLRLLALTLPAYLPEVDGTFLIEEPENGIHPRAVETAFESLSSVYGAQVLLATHSPVILSLAETSQVLCFARGSEGATAMVRGDEHPALSDWRGETNLGVLYAAGVLG